MEKERATKKLIVIKGKGTPRETRIATDVTLYRAKVGGRTVWVSIPED